MEYIFAPLVLNEILEEKYMYITKGYSPVLNKAGSIISNETAVVKPFTSHEASYPSKISIAGYPPVLYIYIYIYIYINGISVK